MNQNAFTRRNFIRASLLGGAALAMPWNTGRAATDAPAAQPGAAMPASVSTTTSRVALTAGTDRADMTFQALKPFAREVAAAIGDKRVIVKPNIVGVRTPLSATDANNMEGILEFLKSIGKADNVLIPESPCGGSIMEGFANLGYDKLAAKYGAKLMDLDKDEYETMYCIDETDFHPHPCRIARTLLDPNHYIISAAKFKTHDRVVATFSLKNIVVGAAIKRADGQRKSSNDKPIIHGGGYRGINYNLFAMARRLHPHLAVIDGYEGMEGNGPISGTPVQSRVCVAGTDWLAADRVAAELMGIDFAKIGYLTYCAQAGLGQADLAKIEILGPALKEHIKTYRMADSFEKQLSWMRPL